MGCEAYGVAQAVPEGSGCGDGHGGVKLGAYGQGGQEDVEVVSLRDATAAGDESGGFQGVFGGGGEAWCDTHVVNNS